jgi:carboxylesterase type B
MLLCGLLRSSTAFNITSLPEMAIVEEVDPPTTRPPLVVATQNGLLSGLSLEASKNKTVSAFLGISYARPPLGNLRFRPPQNPEKWSGILGANQQPPSCMQRPDVFFADFEGAREAEPSMPPSEDCLYLNVFVPDILVRIHQGHDDETASILGNGLPVIVWFHGGGFSSGSSLPRGPLQETWTPDPRELASLGQVIIFKSYKC